MSAEETGNSEFLKKRLHSYLSIAQKAGLLATGETACEAAFRKGDAKLMTVCEDASENTKKKFSQKSFFYHCPYYIYLKKDELQAAIGKQNRSGFAIIDKGLATKIIEILDQLTEKHSKAI